MITSIAPLIYVCSPLRPVGNETILSNVEMARQYCRQVLERGYVPFAPHITGLWDDDADEAVRAEALTCSLRYVSACDELWIFGPRISDGMTIEINWARASGKPIRPQSPEIFTHPIVLGPISC